MADVIKAKAICTLTNSGYTAFQISSWRPQADILVYTSNKRILSQLNLLWGVKAFFYDSNESTDKTILQINDIAKEKLEDLNAYDVEQASKIVLGSARSMGMEVV